MKRAIGLAARVMPATKAPISCDSPIAAASSAMPRHQPDQVLQQQDANDDLAHALVVQRAGGQQFEADDGARKHAGRGDQQAVHQAEAEGPADGEAEGSEARAREQGHHNRLAKQLAEVSRFQVQAEQEKQEDDADIGDIGHQGRVGHEVDASWSEQQPERDVGDDQGLPGIKCRGRKQRGAGEDQEEQKDDGIVHVPRTRPQWRLDGGGRSVDGIGCSSARVGIRATLSLIKV